MTDEAVQTNGTDFVELAADIVSAYVSNNSVPTGELPRIDQRSSFSA
jgi:predicted transcriptional regulator